MTASQLRDALSGRIDGQLLTHLVDGLFAAPHVSMWVKDLEGRYLYVSPAWEESAEVPQEIVIGRRDEDFRPADVAARFREVDRRIVATGRSETREDRIETSRGLRAFITTKFPLRDLEGRIVAVCGISTETTEYRTIPPATRSDQALLAAVIESMPQAIVRFTPDLVVTFANPAFVATYSARGPEIVGSRLGDFLSPTLVDDFRDAIAGLTDQTPRSVVEREGRHADNRPRWQRWQLAAAFDQAGRITEVQAVGSDVTERKLYQAALEGLLSTGHQGDAALPDIVAEVLDIGLSFFGLDTAAVCRPGEGGCVAEFVRQRAGDAPDLAAIGHMVAALPLEGAEPVAEPDARSRGGPAASAGIGSFVAQRLDIGGEFYGRVAFFATAVRTRPFSPRATTLMRLIARWLAFAVERSLRVGDLARSRAELALILESVPARVLSLDGAGATVIANAAARSDPRPEESRALDEAALASGHPIHDYLERWDDGDRVRWMRTDRIPYEDAGTGTRRLLVVANDVTETVARERALAEANEGLNQFAYVASHDLQEPLRKIATFVDVMMEGLASDDRDEVAYAAGVIRDSARRASRLIRDLLAWSRLGNRPLDRQPLPVAEVVREVVREVLAARPGDPVEIVDEMAAATVSADPTQFRQLVENLVVNAVKYRHPGRPPRVVLKLAAARGGRTVFEVEDNGIGFDPVHARQIFEPFRRLHGEAEYPGTGVGLAIVARVCERHGWTVEASGRPGEGAVFRVDMGRPPGARGA